MQDKFDEAMNAITDVQVKLFAKHYHSATIRPVNKYLTEAWLLLFEASHLLSAIEKEKNNGS